MRNDLIAIQSANPLRNSVLLRKRTIPLATRHTL